MSLTLLCFDLDNTLWPVAPVIARAEQETWRWLAARAPDVVARIDVDAMRALRLQLLAENPGYVHNLTALRLPRPVGLPDDVPAFEYFRELENLIDRLHHGQDR